MRPLILFIALWFACHPAPAASPPPNIVVVLVDDMGFSDISCYGSEIPTPNLDRLAAGGLRFTQFYNSARCCPTRAALMTGLYPHQAGMGWMTTDYGAEFPGYRGRLLDQTVTIAEALKPAGYLTAMTGKWHLGQNLGCVPWERGFDRSLNAPAGGFYYSRSAGRDAPQLFLNGRRLDLDAPELPPNWYSTDLWTEFGLRFVDEARAAQKPFFLYLAHNAPHFPVQADPEDIARFRGKYRAGWDVLSAARHRRQLELGIVDKTWKPAPRPEDVAAWDTLSAADKDHFDHLMAIYAACMWRLDRSIGTLVEGLQQRGVLDNTLILFLSDNGGTAEGGLRGQARGPGPLGSADSVVFTGGSWAWLQNAPFRKSKRYADEGGIATPLIAHWPAGIRARGELYHDPAHIIDLMATCLELSGAKLPTRVRGHDVAPLEGISLTPAFRGEPLKRTQPLFWEHEGHAAVREGDWKFLRPAYGEAWELYNLKQDRTEQHNLAAAQPERVRELQAKWDTWAARTHVKPWPEGLDKTAAERAALTNRPARTVIPPSNPPTTPPSALKDAPGRWPAAKALAWQREQPWLVGCNFIPSTAINQLEMWQADTFDPVTIDRELGFAAGLGFNSVRVYLHDLLWKQDAEGFLNRVDQFLGLTQKHGIGVMFVLFDSCWHPLPKLGPQAPPLPHTHNSGWVQSPGVEVLQNPAAQSHLRDYVVGVIRRFGNDPRVQVWDLWNEPDQFDGGSPKRPGLEPKNKPDLVNALLPLVFAWAREARPMQPLTAGVERDLEKLGDFSDLSTVKRILLENSDLITFHHYGSFAQFTNIIASLQSLGRPVHCTEYIARPMGSRFDPHLGYMKEKNVGAYNWGFVSGKTQTIYPWDSWRKDYTNEPPVWFHDILRPDGTPHRSEEADYIRRVTGKQLAWQRAVQPLLHNFNNMYNPCVVEAGGKWRYRMWFFGWSARHANEGMGWGCDAIFHARSRDLKAWEVWCGDDRWDGSMNPALWRPVLLASDRWYDNWHNGDPSVVLERGRYFMAYSATSRHFNKTPGYPSDMVQCVMGATSPDGIHWEKASQPLLIRKEDTAAPPPAPDRIGDFHRPSLHRVGGVWKLWFDYWLPGHGVCLGLAENAGDFAEPGGFEIKHDLNAPLLENWPNPAMVLVGNRWHSFADPGGYPTPPGLARDAQGWMSRQLREAVSDDGLYWKKLDFIPPDSDAPACHVPEALVTQQEGREWLYLFYATQIGNGRHDGRYHYEYDRIRAMRRELYR